MKAKVVGLQHIDYVSKKTEKRVLGTSIYILRKPNTREAPTVEGDVSENIWVSNESGIGLPKFEFGKTYEFNYDTDGRYSFLSSIELATA